MPGTFGTGANQPGVKATSTLSSGVDGASQRGDGVLGKANARGRVGVHGYHGPVLRQVESASVNGSTSSFGVLGELRSSAEGAGVKGTAPLGDGVVGETSSRRKGGVIGLNHARGKNDQLTAGGNGIFGFSSVPNASGVFGAHDNGGTGVAGHSDDGYGVWGTSNRSIGVYGDSTAQAGVRGTSTSNVGVAGHSETSTGVDGTSKSGTGVRGESEEEFGLYAKAPYEPPKADPKTGRFDTAAALAARTRAALLEGLVEIRGDLIINGVELSQLIENIAKWTAAVNYVPPPPPPPPPPPQVIYVPVPARYQPPPYTPRPPVYLAATAAAPKRARGKGKKHKKQGR
jgi:hypothetical protein